MWLITILTPFILSLPQQGNLKHWQEHWTAQEIEAANTGKDATYMSKNEQEVLTISNLVRLYPQKWLNEILPKYLDQRPNEYSKSYVQTLQRDLKKMQPIHALYPHESLYKEARHHGQTTGKKGKIGHRSAKGVSYSKRISKLLTIFESVGENLHYGTDDPLEAVMDLLIDDQIKGVGHRKNALSPNFYFASVSIAPHRKYKNMTTIEFGSKLK